MVLLIIINSTCQIIALFVAENKLLLILPTDFNHELGGDVQLILITYPTSMYQIMMTKM